MSSEHASIIRQNYDLLTKSMDPNPVVGQLEAKGILSESEAKSITDKDCRSDIVKSLLDVLITKPDRAYSELAQALLDSGQPRVARMLRINPLLLGIYY